MQHVLSTLIYYSWDEFKCQNHLETSLLRRLQAQTLPDATSPVGKIYPFTKMAITFEPVMRF